MTLRRPGARLALVVTLLLAPTACVVAPGYGYGYDDGVNIGIGADYYEPLGFDYGGWARVIDPVRRAVDRRDSAAANRARAVFGRQVSRARCRRCRDVVAGWVAEVVAEWGGEVVVADGAEKDGSETPSPNLFRAPHRPPAPRSSRRMRTSWTT